MIARDSVFAIRIGQWFIWTREKKRNSPSLLHCRSVQLGWTGLQGHWNLWITLPVFCIASRYSNHLGISVRSPKWFFSSACTHTLLPSYLLRAVKTRNVTTNLEKTLKLPSLKTTTSVSFLTSGRESKSAFGSVNFFFHIWLSRLYIHNVIRIEMLTHHQQ